MILFLLATVLAAPLPETDVITGVVYDLDDLPRQKPVEIRIVSGDTVIAQGKSEKGGIFMVPYSRLRVVGIKGNKPSFRVDFGPAKAPTAQIFNLPPGVPAFLIITVP